MIQETYKLGFEELMPQGALMEGNLGATAGRTTRPIALAICELARSPVPSAHGVLDPDDITELDEYRGFHERAIISLRPSSCCDCTDRARLKGANKSLTACGQPR